MPSRFVFFRLTDAANDMVASAGVWGYNQPRPFMVPRGTLNLPPNV